VIPNIALIISVYAVARLLNSYVLDDPKVKPLRIIISIIAMASSSCSCSRF
jgi:hypothetical protein